MIHDKDSLSTDVFGLALSDYLRGDHNEDIIVHSSLTEDDVIPLPHLFRNYNEMPETEKKALDLVKGKTLDVGACAGSHSLYLQKKRVDVTALDISPGALKVCRERGVIKTVNSSLLDFQGETFDTILLLMNGTGIFEKLALTDSYLQHLHTLLNPGGQILIDSSDIAFMYEEDDGSYWRDTLMDYYGEVTFSVEYKDQVSEEFDWLYMDYELLRKHGEKNGFSVEKIIAGGHHDYLARLTKTKT